MLMLLLEMVRYPRLGEWMSSVEACLCCGFYVHVLLPDVVVVTIE